MTQLEPQEQIIIQNIVGSFNKLIMDSITYHIFHRMYDDIKTRDEIMCNLAIDAFNAFKPYVNQTIRNNNNIAFSGILKENIKKHLQTCVKLEENKNKIEALDFN